MKRFLAVVGVLAIASLAMAYSRPAGEYSLLLLLNGEPGSMFIIEAGRDGGTVGIANATGSVIKTQCTAAACVCPGATCVCPGASLASNFSTTVGQKIAADGVVYTVLQPSTTQISAVAVSGSTRVDGGAGADCFNWPMK